MSLLRMLMPVAIHDTQLLACDNIYFVGFGGVGVGEGEGEGRLVSFRPDPRSHYIFKHALMPFNTIFIIIFIIIIIVIIIISSP
jgi:hypothetical protein